MGNCENCGKEIIGEGHCQDCKVAHLSLEIEKEKKSIKRLTKWFLVAVVLVVVLGIYVIIKI